MKKRVLITGVISGLLLSVMPVKVQAQHEMISYIYHKHQGAAENGTGCYGSPNYHVHEGSGTKGGNCYRQPVYHSHIGNESEGGGCYTVPVRHIHEGSPEGPGGCYAAAMHQHDEGCYSEEICRFITKSYSDCFRTFSEYCYHHGRTTHGEWNCIMTHDSCGVGDVASTTIMCNTCKYPDNGEHTYEKLQCARQEAEGNVLACGLSDDTVVSYSVGCGLEAGNTIVEYGLSCGSAAETIEGYSVDCGLNTTEPLGYVKITNHTDGMADAVALEASYWDHTAGVLNVGADPYVWTHVSSGTALGRGSSITVRQNGSYMVTLLADNQDIKREGLSVTINVTNIMEAGNSGDNGTNKDKEDGQNKDEDDSGGKGGNNGNSGNDQEKDGESGGKSQDDTRGNENQDKNTQNPKTTPVPDLKHPIGPIRPTPTPGTGHLTDPKYRKPSIITPGTARATARPSAAIRPSATMNPSWSRSDELTEVEGQEVQAWEAGAEADQLQINDLTESTSFLSKPAARAFMITLGGALVLLGLGCVWIWLFRYVGIYGEDGEGGDCFLGYRLIRKEETFLVIIPEHIMDRACTSRYCLKPGILFCKLHEQSELIVEAKNRRVSLLVEKEMKFNY